MNLRKAITYFYVTKRKRMESQDINNNKSGPQRAKPISKDNLPSKSNEGKVFRLTDLPTEMFHHILFQTDPTSLARLRQCCHALNDIVTNDDLLWKEMYLDLFGDTRGYTRQLLPHNSPILALTDSSWLSEMRSRLRLESLLNSVLL